ncbi:hypothetical protein [Pseudodonghicola sp.]|uniref:hypothetical protein n=1 Tax=Pseudodonghicola sp. TaxID=1969463 RepID=UPI003A971480
MFKTEPRHAETLMDKISRAAMEIVDDETEERQIKTDRLRKARLEREASGKSGAAKAAAKGAGNMPGTKPVKKS